MWSIVTSGIPVSARPRRLVSDKLAFAKSELETTFIGTVLPSLSVTLDVYEAESFLSQSANLVWLKSDYYWSVPGLGTGCTAVLVFCKQFNRESAGG